MFNSICLTLGVCYKIFFFAGTDKFEIKQVFAAFESLTFFLYTFLFDSKTADYIRMILESGKAYLLHEDISVYICALKKLLNTNIGSLKPCFQCINHDLSARNVINIMHEAFEFEDFTLAEKSSWASFYSIFSPDAFIVGFSVICFFS